MSVFSKLNQFEFHHVIEASNGICLVMFTGPSCSSCRAWKKLLEKYQHNHPDLALFEVDAEQDMALVREFDVFHLPAIFLFVDGHFHCEFQSEATLAAIERSINTALAAPAQEMP